ncbi:hypothetical protein [Paractinoplanes globisporus]|uniref:Uncharacterized protein n=1 Tax=Paractinoplanes globisporus TaxID=113565 RepID=A0ABW6W9E0_9ACTN|nr:hypothetical protein [Actinoplanes globisporus]
MPADEERRLSARLQTLIGAGGGVTGLAGLRDEATGRFGPAHDVTLAIEHALELRRDSGRTPAESLPIWVNLGERAASSLPPGSATARAIRARHRRQLRACGRPADLDALIGLCRRETDPDARVDLAWALRDRARFAPGLHGLADAGRRPAEAGGGPGQTGGGPGQAGGGPGQTGGGPDQAGGGPGPAGGDVGGGHRDVGGGPGRVGGGDAASDLGEALAITEDEVRRRHPDHVAVTAARLIQAEVLLALGRTDPTAAETALRLTGELAEDDADDQTDQGLPGPRVLLAEALQLAGRTADAGRVARLAYALHPGAFDPARPLLVVARTETGAQAKQTAREALDQREAFFPPESHYVAEARRLVEELTRC